MKRRLLTNKVTEKEEMIDSIKGQLFELQKGQVMPKNEYEKLKQEKEKCRKDAKKFAEEIRMLEK